MPAELECERWTSKTLNGLKLRSKKAAIFDPGVFYVQQAAIYRPKNVRFNAGIGTGVAELRLVSTPMS
jgi:hypothetical protein